MERSVKPKERNAHSSHQNLVALTKVEVWGRVEHLASILPSQGNDIMMEHVEREALSEISLEIRLEEVVSPLEEIPSMVKLDSPQLGEFVLLILGAESIVDSGCHEDGSSADGSSDKLVVFAHDGIQNGRVESGHG